MLGNCFPKRLSHRGGRGSRRRGHRPLATTPLVLLSLASAFMWVRSYRVEEGLELSAVRPDSERVLRFHTKALESSRGRIAFSSDSASSAGDRNLLRPWQFRYAKGKAVRPLMFEVALRQTPDHSVRLLGLRHEQHATPGGRGYATVVPYWMLVALFGAAPVARFLRRARTPRVPAGTCLSCGGDTRGGAFCPHCGAATAASGA